ADASDYGATMVPPFDHPETVAGQGTIAVEILEQLDTTPDLVIVPVGGGGLLAGIATYLAEKAPDCRIVAVEPQGAASLTAAASEGRQVTLSHVDTFVDGASVKRIGDTPWKAYSALADRIDVRTIDEGAVCTAMLDLYQTEGVIAEPAGAMSTAILEYLHIDAGSSVVCILSGGNNDVSRYSEILERSLVHKGLKHYFLVNFPQEPGQLRRFLNEVLGPEDDVTRFEYLKRNNRDTGTALVGIELGYAKDLGALQQRMDASPLHCERLEPGTPAYTYLT
ncbi:pyridoxal-phosphate dependent enzyme, partial [Dietzia sp.]|uniref:pyridoxal-phosphate dependent enzyme n=1 Tax=Dietzia sp. TaxID=1871616 RepID=UPI002FD933C9